MNARSAVIETKAMLNTNKYHMAIIEEGTGQLIHATSPARQGGLLIIYLFLFTSRFTWQFLNLVWNQFTVSIWSTTAELPVKTPFIPAL
jgi:hypothetical protein